MLNRDEIKNDPVVQEFINTLKELHVPYESVYLFGSRSRGDNTLESDYDLFVVLDGKHTRQERNSIYSSISRLTHDRIKKTSFDIVIRDLEDFENNRNVVNVLDQTVYEDGLRL
jgi:predicted nucleotidyltransferase